MAIQELEQSKNYLREIRNTITECGGTISATAGLKDISSSIRSLYGNDPYYHAFWDEYQKKGSLVKYNSAFQTYKWTDANFRPKYDIRPTTCKYLISESRITDLVGILNDCGVTIDFSNSKDILMAYYWCKYLKNVPVVDTRSTTDDVNTMYYMFGMDEELESIEKIILKDTGEQEFNGTFTACYKLTDVKFEGVIGKSISFQNSPLSVESAANVISCLQYLDPEYIGDFTQTIVFNSKTWKAMDETLNGNIDGIGAIVDMYLNQNGYTGYDSYYERFENGEINVAEEFDATLESIPEATEFVRDLKLLINSIGHRFGWITMYDVIDQFYGDIFSDIYKFYIYEEMFWNYA